MAVTQFFMRDFDEEPALLAALEPLLTRASAVVTFNGAGFDLPLLETRFVLARRRWPAALPHLDLLKPGPAGVDGLAGRLPVVHARERRARPRAATTTCRAR